MRRPALLPWFLWVVLLLAGGLAMERGLPQARAQDAPAATPSAPHASSAAMKKELTTVIDAQLAAFRADDYAKAYGFAASSIRGMFQPADFAIMVKTGYPVIAHSVKADYGLAFDTGEEAVINVRIEDASKQSGEFQYLLKKEDGGWRISGVSELKPSGQTV
jgi:hypothetical protein